MNNSNCIYIKFIGPTNYKGSRVQLSTYDISDYENRDKKTIKTVSYDYEIGNVLDQGLDLIRKAGLKPKSVNGRDPKHYIVLCDWDFESMQKLFSK